MMWVGMVLDRCPVPGERVVGPNEKVPIPAVGTSCPHPETGAVRRMDEPEKSSWNHEMQRAERQVRNHGREETTNRH